MREEQAISRKNGLCRALLGGAVAWLALFSLCLLIASVDLFGGRVTLADALSRLQLSTDAAYLALGRSRWLANVYQSGAVFALGACLGLSTLPFDETWTTLRRLSWLHFAATVLSAGAALWFVVSEPWVAFGIGAAGYLAVFLLRWLCWYGETERIREKLGIAESVSPLHWRETVAYLPAALLLCQVLPVTARLCDPVDVPVFSGILYPLLLLPVGAFAAGLTLGKHRGGCPLFPVMCALLYLPMVWILFNTSAWFHCLLAAIPALLGNGLGALLYRHSRGGNREREERQRKRERR